MTTKVFKRVFIPECSGKEDGMSLQTRHVRALWILVFLVLNFGATLQAQKPASTIEYPVLFILAKQAKKVQMYSLNDYQHLKDWSTPTNPHEIIYAPSGNRVYVSNYGSREDAGRSLFVIEFGESMKTKIIELPEGSRPHGFAWLNDHILLITCEGIRSLCVYHEDTGKIQTIPLDHELPHMVVADPDRRVAYVSHIEGGGVSVLQLSDEVFKKFAGTEKISVPVKWLDTGKGTEGIALSRDRKWLFVANRSANTLYKIDTRSLEIVRKTQTCTMPIRVLVTVNNHNVVVSCYKENAIGFYLVDTLKKEAIYKVEDGPIGILQIPNGRVIFVAQSRANRVQVFDIIMKKGVHSIETDVEPDGMTLGVVSLPRKLIK